MNKKIKNANPFNYDGIDFKSKLEKDAYILLKEADLNPSYEAYTFTVFNEFEAKVPFYKSTKCYRFKARNSSIEPITYTPDFVIRYKETLAIIEIKGYPNDVYPIKRKLFRALLEGFKEPVRILFFEPKNIREVRKTIEIIKDDTEES